MPERNLNAEVARALGQITYAFGVLRFYDDGDWIIANFDESLEQCQQYLLPALEKRGLGAKFYDALAVAADRRGEVPTHSELGFAVLQLPPSAWCQAFLEVWGEGGGK